MGIKVEYLGNGEWKLLEELIFLDVIVPAGFCFDGASAPRFLWGILPPMQDTAEAAAVHDYLCRNAKDKQDRRKADRYFAGALFTKSELNFARCLAGYLGVRVGAWWGTGVHYKHWRVNK